MEITKTLIEERARECVSKLKIVNNLHLYSEEAFEEFVQRLILRLWVRTNERDMGGSSTFEMEFCETDDLQKTADVLEEEYMKKFLFKFIITPSKKKSPKGFTLEAYPLKIEP